VVQRVQLGERHYSSLGNLTLEEFATRRADPGNSTSGAASAVHELLAIALPKCDGLLRVFRPPSVPSEGYREKLRYETNSPPGREMNSLRMGY
jgi:hypothetical protein